MMGDEPGETGPKPGEWVALVFADLPRRLNEGKVKWCASGTTLKLMMFLMLQICEHLVAAGHDSG